MFRVICFITLIITAAFVSAQDGQQKKSAKKIPKPKFRISKETTHVLGPLSKNGYIDYAAALNAHYGKGVLKHQNAAVLYFQHIESERGFVNLYKKLGIPIPKKKDSFHNFEKFLKSRYKWSDREIRKLAQDEWRARRHPWTVKKFPQVSAWLKSNEKQLATVAEASRKSKMFAPIVPYGNRDEELLLAATSPEYQMREFGFALEARAMLHLGNGNHDLAWKDLMALQRMGRHIGQGPSILGMVSGISVCSNAIKGQLRLLHFAHPDNSELLGYLRDFKQLPPLPTLTKQVDLYERFSYLDTVQDVSRDEASNLKTLEFMKKRKKIFPRVKQSKEPIDWNIFLKIGNEYFDEMASLLQQSEKEPNGVKVLESIKKLNDSFMSKEAMQKRVDQAKTVQEKFSVVYGFVWLTEMFPELSGMKEAEYRCRQSQRNLIIAFALAAYKNDHKKYPAKLAALSPMYFDKIPKDIYTGKFLKYKTTKDGYLLYSVGPNGKDDKGVSIYSGDKTGDDITTKMPLH